MTTYDFTHYALPRRSEEEMLHRAAEFHALMQQRRSARHFSPEAVPRRLIEIAIETASTAPSGAHRQPWRFVAISDAEDATVPALRRRPLGEISDWNPSLPDVNLE